MALDRHELWRKADRVLSDLLDQIENPTAKDVERLQLEEPLQRCVVRLIESISNGPVSLNHRPQWQLSQFDRQPKGHKIGPWVIECAIGAGGSATVYRAHRATDEFDQQVALKLLNLGHIGTDGAARFEREKRLLAALRHPNIASLLDAGLAEDGVPYIVMEYVDGQRIDDYVSAQGHDLSQRVRLFLSVCEAVAFAQQNFVVHRDIKPSNILVNSHDQVKLLDFGIARLLSSDSDATTTRAFTPGYAAPEQLTGQPITTATDVFGLGLVLYRLVAGLTGNDKQQQPPSGSTLRERGVNPDLTNIILMALREEPQHRYATAQALHDDLLAWLERRPVLATGDALYYRARKFIYRNRAMALGTGLAVMVGLAGLATTLWQAKAANQQAALAQAREATAQAVTRYVQSMLRTLSPTSLAGADSERERQINRFWAQSRHELRHSPDALATVQYSLAELAGDMGLYQTAVAIHEESLQLRQAHLTPASLAVAQSRLAVARWRSVPGTNREDVGDEFRDALALVAAHDSSSEAYLEGLLAFALYLTRHAKVDEARNVFSQAATLATSPRFEGTLLAADIWQARAELFGRLGQARAAAEDLDRALRILVPIVGEQHAKVAHAKATLGYLQVLQLGESVIGLNNIQTAVALDESVFRTPTAQTISHLGFLAVALSESGNYQAAVDVELTRLQQARAVIGDPSREVAVALRNLGTHYLRSKELAQAERYVRESLIIHEAIDPEFHPGVIVTLIQLATIMEHQNNLEQSRDLMVQVVDRLKRWGQAGDAFMAEQQAQLALYEALNEELETAQARLHNSRPLFGDDRRVHLADAYLALVRLRQGRRDDAHRLIEDVYRRLEAEGGSDWGELSYVLGVRAMVLCPEHIACESAHQTATNRLRETFVADHWMTRHLSIIVPDP